MKKGYGQQRGHRQNGPQLPFRLQKELGEAGAGPQKMRGDKKAGGGAAGRKERRRLERTEKKQRKFQFAGKRGAEDDAHDDMRGGQPPRKRQKGERDDRKPQQPLRGADRGGAGRDGGRGPAAPRARPLSSLQQRLLEENENDIRLQKQLEKKLQGRTTGPNDGLGGFLRGLKAGSDLVALPEGIDKDKAALGQPRARPPPKPSAFGRGHDSDSEVDDIAPEDDEEIDSDEASGYDSDEKAGRVAGARGGAAAGPASMRRGGDSDFDDDSDGEEEEEEDEDEEEGSSGDDEVMWESDMEDGMFEEDGEGASGSDGDDDSDGSDGDDDDDGLYGSDDGGLDFDMEGGDSGEEEEEDEGEEEEPQQRRGKASAAAAAAAGPGSAKWKGVAAAEAAPAAAVGRYVPPAQRAALAAAAGGQDERLTRRVKGLLNRIGEANAVAITTEACGLVGEGFMRRGVSEAVTREIVTALSEGPRCSAAYAFALASFVCGLSATIGSEVAARLLAALAAAIAESRKQDSARAGYNLCLLFSALFMAGLTQPQLVWGLLGDLTRTLEELDVALTLSVLRTAGAKLRSEDPAGLRDFILKLQERSAQAQQQQPAAAAKAQGSGPKAKALAAAAAASAAAARASAAAAGGDGAGLSTRARLLLELVCDLKNGKKGGKLGGGAAGDGSTEFPPALVKWVRESGVGEVNVALRSLTWEKLLDTASHKGQWWLPEAAGTAEWEGKRLEERQKAAADASRQGAELLRAAAALRMNTASRKAVFCCIMGADDFVDAFERVVKLALPEAQDREVLRVVIECLCHEKGYNPFYQHLAARLCGFAKRHRVTLQFALWDQWKELAGADVRRISHLARFAAALIAEGSLSVSALKVIDDLANPSALSSKEVLHFKLLLQELLTKPQLPAVVTAFRRADPRRLLFLRLQTLAERMRIAGKSELAPLRAGLLLFITDQVLKGVDPTDRGPGALLLARAKAAENAMQGEAMIEERVPR